MLHCGVKCTIKSTSILFFGMNRKREEDIAHHIDICVHCASNESTINNVNAMKLMDFHTFRNNFIFQFILRHCVQLTYQRLVKPRLLFSFFLSQFYCVVTIHTDFHWFLPPCIHYSVMFCCDGIELMLMLNQCVLFTRNHSLVICDFSTFALNFLRFFFHRFQALIL